MRDFQNHQDHDVFTVFGGGHVSQGYRGRRSPPQARTGISAPAAVVLGALVFGFATAATAITISRSHAPKMELAGQSLPANFKMEPGSDGYEQALY